MVETIESLVGWIGQLLAFDLGVITVGTLVLISMIGTAIGIIVQSLRK